MTTETFSLTGPRVPSIPMDPAAVLDYTFDWTEWLAAIADTAASIVPVVDGVVKHSDLVVAGVHTVWLKTPTAGVQVASATSRITTVGGRVDERTIYLLIRER